MPWNSPKRPPYWNSTSGFDFDHITAVDTRHVILHQSANFIQIGPPSAEKMTSCRFSRWRISTTLDFIKKFNELIGNVNWDNLYQCSSVDKAYGFFHKKITDCHDKCFPKVRLSRKRAKDKLWVTRGIKRSSNYKNKLFKKWICSRSADDKKKYKDYEKIFKKVTLAADSLL